MPLILGANSVSGGYEVDNSLRFNSGSSDSLTRTMSSSGSSRTTFTFSTWFKLSGIGSTNALFGSGDATSFFLFQIGTTGRISIEDYDGVANAYRLRWVTPTTGPLLRDPSAWYHLVVAIDTTQATSGNRVKIYLNGENITSLFTANNSPAQNDVFQINNNNPITIGNQPYTDPYMSGYQTEFYFIDGQQLDETSFGETDQDTNIWIPKAYTGSFGTNGFYLEFQNSGALGTDSSGNGNNFTVNNLTSIDQTTDTPTNNFCTGNPLFPFVTTAPTYSDGNLTILGNAGANTYANGTFMVSKGKWYFETTCTDNDTSIGVKIPTSNSAFNTSGGGFYGFLNQNGNKITDGVSSASQSAGSNNDILQLALDMDNNKLWVGRNGTYFASGDPSAGTNAFISSLPTELVPSFQSYNNTMKFNFGNPPFTISSGNADANGYGNFEYAVPAGYYSLCTKNLAEYA